MRKIINKIRNSILHRLAAAVFEKVEAEGFVVSYAQGGEDLIIKKLLGNKRSGFYVDIGCNNPIQKSNTFKLYLKGWTGICVDGNAALIDKFKKIRPRDLCLHQVLSDKVEKLTFYVNKNNHEYSTVDAGIAGDWSHTQQVEKMEVQADTLSNVLNKHLNGRHIDLLCIDVEGHDLAILLGNDFSKHRPGLICTEAGTSIVHSLEHPITQFLVSRGYDYVACCGENMYFRDGNLMTGDLENLLQSPDASH